MEKEQNKFLMIIAATLLLSTVVFFTYLIFKSNEKTKPKESTIKEDLNINITGETNKTLNILPSTWIDTKNADTDENISKMIFEVDTGKSTITEVSYNIFLELNNLEISDEMLKKINYKIFKLNDLNTPVSIGNFSTYSKETNSIIMVSNIPIEYGGNIDEYKLYVYLDKTSIDNLKENISLNTKVVVKSNK